MTSKIQSAIKYLNPCMKKQPKELRRLTDVLQLAHEESRTNTPTYDSCLSNLPLRLFLPYTKSEISTKELTQVFMGDEIL